MDRSAGPPDASYAISYAGSGTMLVSGLCRPMCARRSKLYSQAALGLLPSSCTTNGERERERERFTTSIQPAWLMRTGLCSCLSLLQQGIETMADRLLVLVPHEHMHAPRSILEQARKLGPDVTEMRAIKHTMELIAHSSPTAVYAETGLKQETSNGHQWATLPSSGHTACSQR